ncbi:MAG: aldehyde dehydrogenase family protein, partial [Chlorobi bacterium]|nr:aldehyde dehydrogenase family protein [Chlorobiota bacterium]
MDVKRALQEVFNYFDIDPKGHSGASTGTKWLPTNGEELASYSPIDGSLIGTVKQPTQEYIDEVVEQARKTFEDYWRMVPAPKRGELVREIADEVRKHKEMLARLITIEMGKIIQESRGEVQEWIDMCDFAVGLSRQLYGLTIASE